jgi:hypothetical protein
MESRTRRGLAALAVVTCVLLTAGCGDDEPETIDNAEQTASESTPAESTPAESTEPSPTTEPSSPAAEDAAQVIEITFEGDSVTPNGDRVEVKAGEPIELRVTADAPGEIHVHSNPEQELAYSVGSSTLDLTIDQPGIVEVESHELEKIIVQLEVTP